MKALARLALAALAATLFAFPALAQSTPSQAVSFSSPPPKQIYKQLGTCSFLDYAPSSVTGQELTLQVQNFLLDCQLKALATMNYNIGFDNLGQRTGIIARFPKMNIKLVSPIIVPEYVILDDLANFSISDASTGGAITNAYTGDTTTKALANLEQPLFLIVPHAHLRMLNVVSQSSGGLHGSGVWAGKNWLPSAVSQVNASGSGSTQCKNYTINDILTLAQPSKGPYVAAQVTVNTVDGNGCPATWTLSTAGSYALPPFLQTQQWTVANNFTGSIAAGTIGKVCDPVNTTSGVCAFFTSGGTGTGAEFSVTWTPDFAGGGATYSAGANLAADTVIDHLEVDQAGSTNDATYGPQVGFGISGLNYTIGDILTGGGVYGTFCNGGTDVHFVGALNSVAATTNLRLQGCGAVVVPDFVPDTPSADYLEIDNSTQISIRGANTRNSSVSTVTPASVVFGSHSASTANDNSSLDIHLALSNAGTVAGVPALSCAYTDSSNIEISVSNTKHNSAVTNPNTTYATFGTGCSDQNYIHGQIDSVSINPFTGTVPKNVWVWQSAINAYATGQGGNYAISTYPVYSSEDSTIGQTLALGVGALAALPSSSAAYADVCIGYNACTALNNTAAIKNTAVGTLSCSSITSGTLNTCVGQGAGGNISTGGSDTFIGQSAASGNGGSLTGSSNTCVGRSCLSNITGAAASNVVIGALAGGTITSGSSNVVIGKQVADTTLQTGQRDIIIGTASNCDASAAGANDEFDLCESTTSTPLIRGNLANATPLVTINAPVVKGGGTPTLSGTCTTNTQVGGNTAGTFHATCTSQTVIITFATSAPNGWVCIATDETTVGDSLKQTATAVGSCTLTGTTAAADVIGFIAEGY